MHTTEIVVGKMQRDSGFKMRQFLAERIGEPSKAPKLHPHGRILPFDKASRDMVRIGITHSDFGYNPRDAWWGVPRIGRIELPVVAKHLRELGEVYVRPKALRDLTV